VSTVELILFFDGNCPFCADEMGRLAKWNTNGKLDFVDIAKPQFDPKPLHLTMEALDRELHSKTADGTILIGIDSMLAAYSLLGKGWLVFPLRIRALRPLWSYLYRKFALNRYRISGWLGYKVTPICANGVCRTRLPFLKKGEQHE
jgi:predicted DCC family thiol-disulfide oxidoreductase YuxK